VIFELDCKMVVDDMHSNKLNRSDQSCKLVKFYSKFITTMKLFFLDIKQTKAFMLLHGQIYLMFLAVFLM